MLKRLAAILMMTIAVSLGGALVGYVAGSILYERAQHRVETNPHSIQGDIGGYLCLAGWLPIQLGVLGTGLGIAIGLGVGIGGSIWAEAKELEHEQE